jgi:hypothetical protein
MAVSKPGQVVRFTYNHLAVDEDSGDRHKEVLVLHPHWQGKMHGIDLKRLTTAEREVLNAILDPETKKKPHRLPLVNDILRRMDPITEIRNPMTFYSRFVKVFLRNKDAYRTYYPTRMLNVTVVQQTHVQGNVFNPKPLFHGTTSKPQPTQPTTGPMSPAEKARQELIAKVAKEKGVGVSKKPVAATQTPAEKMAAMKASLHKSFAKFKDDETPRTKTGGKVLTKPTKGKVKKPGRPK